MLRVQPERADDPEACNRRLCTPPRLRAPNANRESKTGSAGFSPFNLPVLAAGAGLEGNRHIHVRCAIENPDQNNWGYDQNRLGCEDGERTPLANLRLTVLRTLGSRAPAFGESTGTLDGRWS